MKRFGCIEGVCENLLLKSKSRASIHADYDPHSLICLATCQPRLVRSLQFPVMFLWILSFTQSGRRPNTTPSLQARCSQSVSQITTIYSHSLLCFSGSQRSRSFAFIIHLEPDLGQMETPYRGSLIGQMSSTVEHTTVGASLVLAIHVPSQMPQCQPYWTVLSDKATQYGILSSIKIIRSTVSAVLRATLQST